MDLPISFAHYPELQERKMTILALLPEALKIVQDLFE
jgi:hypothetical protein